MTGTERTSTAMRAQPLARRHMPPDHAISLAAYTGRGTPNEKRIPDDFGPKQSMRGFEETYRNIIDYIVRITYRIWEDREIEYIGATYTDDSLVYDDYGLQIGNRKIIDDTHHTTGAFSNIQLIADEIVWAGDDEVGFHTSHRTLIRGTNDGDSHYGPATMRDVDVLVIANCVSLENSDLPRARLLQHLQHAPSARPGPRRGRAPAGLFPASGMAPERRHVARTGRRGSPGTAPVARVTPVDGFDVDRFVRADLDAAWKRRDHAALAASRAPGFVGRGPSDRVFAGAPAYREFIDSFTAQFPDLDLQVDEIYWMGNEREGYLSAARWSATGTHTGSGRYGPASGAPVQVWGITQHEISGGRITREWMLFNELDLMMQIAAARRQMTERLP